MKMDTTHGESRLIIVGQLTATIAMLTKALPHAEGGFNKKTYEVVDFDMLRRLQDNLEEWAAS